VCPRVPHTVEAAPTITLEQDETEKALSRHSLIGDVVTYSQIGLVPPFLLRRHLRGALHDHGFRIDERPRWAVLAAAQPVCWRTRQNRHIGRPPGEHT
jgi:hypothetical protein